MRGITVQSLVLSVFGSWEPNPPLWLNHVCPSWLCAGGGAVSSLLGCRGLQETGALGLVSQSMRALAHKVIKMGSSREESLWRQRRKPNKSEAEKEPQVLINIRREVRFGGTPGWASLTLVSCWAPSSFARQTTLRAGPFWLPQVRIRLCLGPALLKLILRSSRQEQEKTEILAFFATYTDTHTHSPTQTALWIHRQNAMEHTNNNTCHIVDAITDSVDVSLRKLWETLKDREAWCATAHGVAKGQTI